MKPYYHAESSARKWGGEPEDYLKIHDWFDATKASFPDNRHRALRHHGEGIFECERVFGHYITNSRGQKVSVRDIGEQHVLEDFRGLFIPTIADYLKEMDVLPWMVNAQDGEYPDSAKKYMDKKVEDVPVKENQPTNKPVTDPITKLANVRIDGSFGQHTFHQPTGGYDWSGFPTGTAERWLESQRDEKGNIMVPDAGPHNIPIVKKGIFDLDFGDQIYDGVIPNGGCPTGMGLPVKDTGGFLCSNPSGGHLDLTGDGSRPFYSMTVDGSGTSMNPYQIGSSKVTLNELEDFLKKNPHLWNMINVDHSGYPSPYIGHPYGTC